jgi:hypothetical protein
LLFCNQKSCIHIYAFKINIFIFYVYEQTKAKDSWFKKNADALGIDIEEFDKKVEESNCPSTRKEILELKKLQQVAINYRL